MIVLKQYRNENQEAYHRLKPTIDQSYPQGRYIAIGDGRVVADAGTFDELTAALKVQGRDFREVLVVQAGVNYPDFVYILIQGANP